MFSSARLKSSQEFHKNCKMMRAPRTEASQYEKMLEYLETYPQMRMPDSKTKCKELLKLWGELTQELNSTSGDDHQLTVAQWRKVFTTWKSATKCKARKILNGESEQRLKMREKRLVVIYHGEWLRDVSDWETLGLIESMPAQPGPSRSDMSRRADSSAYHTQFNSDATFAEMQFPDQPQPQLGTDTDRAAQYEIAVQLERVANNVGSLTGCLDNMLRFCTIQSTQTTNILQQFYEHNEQLIKSHQNSLDILLCYQNW